MKPLVQAVPARYFGQLVDHLEANGTPCRDSLAQAQVRALNDPAAKLTLPMMDALVRDLFRLSGRDDLGFVLGRLIKLNSHDVLGYALISCPNMDHLFRLVSRYYRLMTPAFSMRYQRNANQVELIYFPVLGLSEMALQFHYEAIAVSAHLQIMSITEGRQGPYDVYLPMPAPAHAKRYRELAPARFHWNLSEQPMLRMVLGAEQFDQPLAMTDMRALAAAEARCKLMMQEFTATSSWSDWVAMMLREAEDSQPTLEELARILNMSVRTLDRHLQKEATRFRELALAIRNERACQMLAEGRQAISQIAYRLGYSDIANFSRSFKKMNGVSPTAYAASSSQAMAVEI